MNETHLADLPREIGGHRVTGRLGAGGTAEVFAIETKAGGRPLCLKRVRPTLAADIAFLLAFEAEIDRHRRLDHPNLVRLYESGNDGGPYVVLERVEGVTLGALRRAAGRLAGPLVADIGRALASGLAYLHTESHRPKRPAMLHLDLAPDNVLISPAGEIKLTDFGMGKALVATGASTTTDLRGRPRHLAPEQYAGAPIGAGTDLFLLGLTLWIALVGSHPYAEGRPPAMRLDAFLEEATLANRRRALVDAAPMTPTGLVEVVEGLLCPWDERTRSADRVRQRLDEVAPSADPAHLGRQVQALLALRAAP